MKFLWEDIDFNTGQLSLFLLIFQSIGIRFFPGIGVLLLFLIILINKNNIRLLTRQSFVYIITLIIIICLIQETDLKTITLYILIAIASVCAIGRYTEVKNSFIQDFKGVASFFCLYGSITFFVILLLPQVFTTASFDNKYISFLGILYTKSSTINQGWHRISSLAWEPGCFQLISSFYLLISLYERNSTKKILWLLIIQILTGSTMGYINLIIIVIFLLIENRKSINLILYITVLSTLILPIIQTNLYDKIEGSGSGSSTIRLRDFLVGFDKLKENPIIGFPVSKIYEDSKAQNLEDKIWAESSNFSKVEELGYFSGGFTNGLLGLFLNLGIPFALWILYMFYNSPLIPRVSKSFTITFFVIFILTTVSEPITFTPFFLIFPFSYLYKPEFMLRKSRIKFIKKQINL